MLHVQREAYIVFLSTLGLNGWTIYQRRIASVDWTEAFIIRSLSQVENP